MASIIMHLAVTSEVARHHAFKDIERLKFGAALPDASKGKAAHLHKFVWGFNKKVYDFEFYREKFGELMKTDDLYLGYYLHLVQDICYRHFVYDKYKWNPTIPGNVEKLHRDYAILNCYVANKYDLEEDLVFPEEFAKEPINDLAEYNLDWLKETYHGFFKKVDYDDIFFFTKEMADEFIEEATQLCLKELKALETGDKLIESYDNAWVNMTYSLLETTQNTRDLGTYRIDGTERYTKARSLIRSDCANYPSERDIEFLKSSGITTIIDYRSKDEKAAKPHGLADKEGFDYHDLPIEEGSGVPESVEAVPESYFRIAHATNLPKVFETIAGAPGGVMFNCSAGKDRTGVISALILWLCGVRKSDIVFDYMRTKDNNKERFELIHKNFPDLDMNIVIPNENNMIRFMEMLEEKYGTIESYFSAIGIDTATQTKLKAKLGVNGDGSL